MSIKSDKPTEKELVDIAHAAFVTDSRWDYRTKLLATMGLTRETEPSLRFFAETLDREWKHDKEVLKDFESTKKLSGIGICPKEILLPCYLGVQSILIQELILAQPHHRFHIDQAVKLLSQERFQVVLHQQVASLGLPSCLARPCYYQVFVGVFDPKAASGCDSREANQFHKWSIESSRTLYGALLSMLPSSSPFSCLYLWDKPGDPTTIQLPTTPEPLIPFVLMQPLPGLLLNLCITRRPRSEKFCLTCLTMEAAQRERGSEQNRSSYETGGAFDFSRVLLHNDGHEEFTNANVCPILKVLPNLVPIHRLWVASQGAFGGKIYDQKALHDLSNPPEHFGVEAYTHAFVAMLLQAPKSHHTQQSTSLISQVFQLTRKQSENGLPDLADWIPKDSTEPCRIRNYQGRPSETITVTLIDRIKYGNRKAGDFSWIERKVKIEGSVDGRYVQNQVTHYTVLTWPDNSVPENIDGFVRFVLHVMKHQYAHYPGLAHCTQGLKRTGVFVVFYECLRIAWAFFNRPQQAKETFSQFIHEPDVVGPFSNFFKEDFVALQIDNLQRLRFNMLTMEEQIKFIYSALRHAWDKWEAKDSSYYLDLNFGN
ncbi:hypothetical protein T439DRAFT_376828 [Meredithblackwellia eburnea MCA 4105]